MHYVFLFYLFWKLKIYLKPCHLLPQYRISFPSEISFNKVSIFRSGSVSKNELIT